MSVQRAWGGVRGALEGRRRKRRKSGGRPQPAGGGGGGSGAARNGLAEQRGLKDDALWKWRERCNEGRAGEGRAEGPERGSPRRCAEPGEGLRAPEPERVAGPGLLEAALGSRRPRRQRKDSRWASPARSGLPAASPTRSLPPPFPPSARPHLPSLAFLFPSALRARGKACSSPSPGALYPAPSRAVVPAAAPAWAMGVFRCGGGLRVPGFFSWRRQGLASCPERWPPFPKGKNWLPLTAEPVWRAGARKGVSSP